MPKFKARPVPGNVDWQKSGQVLAINWHVIYEVAMLTGTAQERCQSDGCDKTPVQGPPDTNYDIYQTEKKEANTGDSVMYVPQ